MTCEIHVGENKFSPCALIRTQVLSQSLTIKDEVKLLAIIGRHISKFHYYLYMTRGGSMRFPGRKILDLLQHRFVFVFCWENIDCRWDQQLTNCLVKWEIRLTLVCLLWGAADFLFADVFFWGGGAGA